MPMKMTSTKKYKEYLQLKKIPSPKELENYYKNIYFQQTKGAYQKKYSSDEVKYIINNLGIISIAAERVLRMPFTNKLFLDLGAGEGWALKHFHSIGCKVTGVDISGFAVKKFNKAFLKCFIEADLKKFISKAIKEKSKFDIINLTNVIEHVFEPESLLLSIKKILNKDGLLLITFPNDFSPLHQLLLKSNKIRNPFWVVSPDHISYFNKKSFSKLSKRIGFQPVQFLADFPIDLFLLNDYSNYIIDKSKGKQAHFSRIDFINLICKLDKQASVDFLLKLGEIGIGRNLTAYLKLK